MSCSFIQKIQDVILLVCQYLIEEHEVLGQSQCAGRLQLQLHLVHQEGVWDIQLMGTEFKEHLLLAI